MAHRDDLIKHYATLPPNTMFVRPDDVVRLVRAREVPARARMLDIGCGQGQAAMALAQAFPDAEVWGIDLSPQQIEHAQRATHDARLPNVRFAVSDWSDFALPPDGVDVIVCTQVIQFLEDEHGFMEYIASGLANNGHVLLRSVFLPEDEPGRSFVENVSKQWIASSIRYYSERDLTELLRDVGLSRFRIDKEELWLDQIPPQRHAILQRELAAIRATIDAVQPWFWAGTISAVRQGS